MPRGVGGPSVAQTWRDEVNLPIKGVLTDGVVSGVINLAFANVDFLPTQNRWRALIDSEILLLEGTSGGISVGAGNVGVSGDLYNSGAAAVRIVFRGYDGTIAQDHLSGAQAKWLNPNVTYGANLVSVEKGQFAFPQEQTSGGIQGVKVVPQMQSVYVWGAQQSGPTISGSSVVYNSGQVVIFDPSNLSPYLGKEFIWVVERNNQTVNSGSYYDGQFVGFSQGYNTSGGIQQGVASPIYLVNIGVGTAAVSGCPSSGCWSGYCSPSGCLSGFCPASGCLSGFCPASGCMSGFCQSSGCYSGICPPGGAPKNCVRILDDITISCTASGVLTVTKTYKWITFSGCMNWAITSASGGCSGAV